MSEGFLSRWARRKEAVRAAETAPDIRGEGGAEGAAGLDPALPPAPSSSQGGGETPASEAALQDDRHGASAEATRADSENPFPDLPSLDALTAETDLTPFLRAGVPAALRNAALRRMWSLDPSIRDFVSEAREYAYDWNTPGGVPGLGPLLPGDDVKAMLGRLFRDPAEAGNSAAEEEDRADPPQAEAEPTDSAQPPSESLEAAAEGVPTGPSLAAPEQPAAAAGASVAATVVKPPPARPRLRRHGGAMPA